MMSPNASRALARRDGFASAAASKVVSEPRISACSAPPWFPSADARRSPSWPFPAHRPQDGCPEIGVVGPARCSQVIWSGPRARARAFRRGRRSTTAATGCGSRLYSSRSTRRPHRFQHSQRGSPPFWACLTSRLFSRSASTALSVDAKRARSRAHPPEKTANPANALCSSSSSSAWLQSSVARSACWRGGASRGPPTRTVSASSKRPIISSGVGGSRAPRRAQWPGIPSTRCADIRNGKGVGFVEHEAEIARPAALHEELDCRRLLNAPGIEPLL